MSDINTQQAPAQQQSQQQTSAIDPNTMAVLAQLIQQSQQQPPMSMAPTATSPGGINPAGAQMLQQTQPQGNVQGNQQPQLSPVQQMQMDAATKALKKQYDVHAANTPTPILEAHVNNQAILPPKNPLTSEGFNPQTGQVQEGGFAERALRGLVTGGLPGMLGGLLGPSINQQMEQVPGARNIAIMSRLLNSMPQLNQSSQNATSSSNQIPSPQGGQLPSQNETLPPLTDMVSKMGLSTAPFGQNPQSDYYMQNPNTLEAIREGKFLIPKSDQMLERENPLRLSQAGNWIEQHIPQLKKSGYANNDILQSLGPESSDVAETIKGIGTYKQAENALLGGMQSSPLTRSAYIGMTRKLYPNYDVNKFDQAQTYRKQLADDSGNALGSRVVSANTVAQHLALLGNVAKQLQNQNAPAGNAIINFVRTNLGHPEVTNFDQAKEIVTNEVQSILSQRGSTQTGVERMSKDLNANMSGQQLNEWIKNITVPLVAERIQALRSQYKSNIGSDDDGEILYPETRQQFNQLTDGHDVFKDYDNGKNPFKSISSNNNSSSLSVPSKYNFKTEQDALGAKLPKGTIISIGGRRARID